MANVEIFSGPNCGYCVSAKNLFAALGVSFIERDISRPEQRQEFIRRLPRVRSVPQIFINELHVGGFDDLQILKNNGRLTEMLSV